MKELTFKQKASRYRKAQTSLNKSIREAHDLIADNMCPTAGEENLLESAIKDLQRAQANFIKARLRWTGSEG